MNLINQSEKQAGPNFGRHLLLALLCSGLSSNSPAANERSKAEIAQPSEWVARGFVPPGGEPKCMVDPPSVLSRELLDRLCYEARSGKPKAQHILGQLFFLTNGVNEQDFDDAFRWFNLAAAQDLPAAQYGMGLLHTYNLGIVGDLGEANKWMLKAANGGHDNAQYWLGLYYSAAIRRSDANTLESIKWLTRSAEQGNLLAAEVLSNTTKRRALGSDTATEANGKYEFTISLAACTEGYGLNDQNVSQKIDRERFRSDNSTNNPNLYRYYSQPDMLRAIKKGPAQYMGMMGRCFEGTASRLGPGFIKWPD